MGRKRKHDKHLPRRMYQRRGSYFLVEANGKWINLGRDFAQAMAKYGELVGASRRCLYLGDIIERYRIDVLPHKNSKTQKDQGRQLDRLASVFGELRPEDITPQYIYRYLDSRMKTPVAARHEVSLLGHVFSKAIRWGAANSNPVQLVAKPKSNPRDRYVTDDDYFTVYNLASDRIKIAMDLALLTGLRRGDLLSLTREHLTEDGILIKTGKTGKALLIEYTPDLLAVLERAKCLRPQVPGKYIIRTKSGKAYSPSGYATNWKRVMQKAVEAGIESFTFHDLRAKSASDTIDIQQASARLGHSSTSITKRVYMRAPQKVKPLR